MPNVATALRDLVSYTEAIDKSLDVLDGVLKIKDQEIADLHKHVAELQAALGQQKKLTAGAFRREDDTSHRLLDAIADLPEAYSNLDWVEDVNDAILRLRRDLQRRPSAEDVANLKAALNILDTVLSQSLKAILPLIVGKPEFTGRTTWWTAAASYIRRLEQTINRLKA